MGGTADHDACTKQASTNYSVVLAGTQINKMLGRRVAFWEMSRHADPLECFEGMSKHVTLWLFYLDSHTTYHKVH